MIYSTVALKKKRMAEFQEMQKRIERLSNMAKDVKTEPRRTPLVWSMTTVRKTLDFILNKYIYY